MKMDSRSSTLTFSRLPILLVALTTTLFANAIEAQQTDWQDTVKRLADFYHQQPEEPLRSESMPGPKPAPAPGFLSRFPPGEELIFTLNVAGFDRGELFAVSSEQGLKIGLSELAALLDFQIEVNDDLTSAQGWFINESKTFLLQRASDELYIINSAGQDIPVLASDFTIDGDIMLEVAILARALDLTFKADESRLILYVTSRNTFPFESAEARRSRLTGTGFTQAPSVLPEMSNDYGLYTPPLLDAQVSARASDTSTFTGYSLASSQDLAYANTQLYLAGDDDDALREARLTLSRESEDGNVLGLPLTYAAIGDVLPVNAGIGQTSSFGRGLALANVKNELADNRQVNFTGVIQAGWDVELYRNGILMANDLNIRDGRYEFTDVELLYGNNDFELVFYGPQGQIQREQKSYVVDSNSLKKGQNSFRFSLVDGDETLLGVTNVTDDPQRKGINAGFVFDRGLSDWYTFGVGGTIFEPDAGDSLSTVSLRNNISMGGAGLVNSIIQFNNQQQKNYLISYRNRFYNNSLSISWRKNARPVTSSIEEDPVVIDMGQSLGITLSGRLNDWMIPLSYESAWSSSWNAQGRRNESFRQSVFANTSMGGINYSLLGYHGDVDTPNADWAYTSELGYRTRIGGSFTRLYASYLHAPESTFDSVGATINYPFSNQFNGELRYAYSAISHNASYNARLNWLGEKVSVSSYASYSDTDLWSVSLLIRFGIGLNADKESFSLSPRSITGSGALAVRVYEDNNMNAVYDEDEPLLDGIKVSAAQVSRRGITENGMAFIERLPKNRRTDIVIDESTLPDFTYTRTDKGFSVTGRPGLLQFADIPVVRGGELDGTVYLTESNGEERPLAYITLHLISETEGVVATTKSEYDGFYLFDKVLPGRYKLMVDARDLRKQNAAIEIAKKLDVSNRGDIFTNVDVVLRELTPTSGYMAQVNEFSSLQLLKVYVSLINKRLPDSLVKDAFYMKDNNDNRFRLGLGYHEDKATIEQLCNTLADYEIDCEVTSLEFGY